MIVYSYKYKKQGDGKDSWTRTRTEDNKVVFVDMVYFISCANWKLKAILNEDKLLTQVESALNGLPEPTKTNANFGWNNAPTIDSNSTTTQFIQGVLKLTLDQVIDIFTRAQNFNI